MLIYLFVKLLYMISSNAYLITCKTSMMSSNAYLFAFKNFDICQQVLPSTHLINYKTLICDASILILSAS